MRMLSKYINVDIQQQNINIANDIEFLKHAKDKQYISKLLFKEISSSQSPEYINLCAIFALESLDKEIFENSAVEFLQNKEIPDEKKFFIISLIKQKGIYFDYEEIEKYIKNPEEIAQNGVKDFLINTIFDSEVQIDLIDFYLNIPKSEKIYLLTNIATNEDVADSIACAVSIIVQLNIEKEEFEIAKNILIESKSLYAIEGIEYILKNYKINLKERRKLQNQLQQLKNINPEFINNEIIKNSEIYDSYISFIDGNSNFFLILSRKMQDESIDAILLTISTREGISACMGFGNIAISNYTTIKKRLFCDSRPIKINPIAFKALFKHYKDKNKRTNTPLPYELIVWEKLLSDIQDINYDISEFINSKLDSTNLSEEKVRKFLDSKVTETWHWTQGQNKSIDNLIEKIEDEHIVNYKDIEKLINDNIQSDFIDNPEFMTEIKDRLLLGAYIASLANLKISSQVAYSLCFKNPYLKLLISNLIDKSIYEYLASIYEENIKQNAQSIFKRGKKTSFNIQEIDKLMADIEEKWK